MTETKINTLINHLVTTWPTNTTFGGHRLQVVDGPAAVDIRNDVLFIGHSTIGPTYSAIGTQEWSQVGNLRRKELLTVNCSLRVAGGSKDLSACRTRAIAIFDGLTALFRGTVASATANGEFQQIELSRFQLYQELANGASVTLEFAINATARV